VAGPCLLAAHSLGGGYARRFAQLFPADVAGLRYLDSPSMSGSTSTCPRSCTWPTSASPTQARSSWRSCGRLGVEPVRSDQEDVAVFRGGLKGRVEARG